MPKDRPILFSAAMVNALLRGEKTMTRRLLYADRKMTAKTTYDRRYPPERERNVETEWPDLPPGRCWTLGPWADVKPGDRLWVRESLKLGYWPRRVRYAADDAEAPEHDDEWMTKTYPRISVPGIHMCRWASRLTLAVTAVRIERVRDITPADCIAEGITGSDRNWYAGDLAQGTDPVATFQALWWALHGIESWNSNPWVVAMTFQVHSANIDALKEAA